MLVPDLDSANLGIKTGWIYTLNKSQLHKELKGLGLPTDQSVRESRKALQQFFKEDHQLMPLNMEETDDVCFVCDKTIPSGKWKYKLQVTATKKTNVPVADLIKELVGDEFAVLVGERDAVCSRCMNLLNLMDSLAVQLGEVQTTLSQFLHSKYNLTSERIKFQIQYDSSMLEEPEPLHTCDKCNFETKYEKEFNMHIRTHLKIPSPVIQNKTPKKKTKTNLPKLPTPEKPKKVFEKKIPEMKVAVKKLTEKKVTEKNLAEKKVTEKKITEKKITEKKVTEKKIAEKKVTEKKIAQKKIEAKKPPQSTPNLSLSKMNTRVSTGSLKRKKYHNSLPITKDNSGSKEINKSKKTKIVFQCSVCDKMFTNENSVRTHAKKEHGNDKIIVSDEEYADIETLESSDEEGTALTNSPTANETKSVSLSSPKLDFLDDWEEDEENDDLSPAKKVKTGDDTSSETPETKKKVRGRTLRKSLEYDEDNNEDDDSKDTSTKPTCLYCNTTFSSIESVQDHIKLSHNDPNSRLNIVLKSSPVAASTDASFEIDSTTDIAENKKQATGNNKLPSKSYKCNLCGIKRVNLQFIQQHIKTHKRKLSLQCKLCGTSFKNIVALKIHASKCHKAASSTPKKCGFCKFRFFDRVQLKNHVKKVHHKDLRKINLNSSKKSSGSLLESSTVLKPEQSVKFNEGDNSLSKTGSVSMSDTCKISVSEVSSTSLEMEIEHNRLKFACALCSVTSSTELEFREHVEKLHDIKEERRKDEIVKLSLHKAEISAKLECKECNITFSRPSRLTDHMNRHKAKTCLSLGICVYCETLYLDKDQVIIHTNIVHENLKTNPKCPVCSKTYSHAKDLKIHYVRVHFSEKADKLIKQVTELKKNKKETVTTSCNDEANDVYSKVFKELQDLTGEGNEIVEDASVKRHAIAYSCPLCSYNSLDKGEVNSHLPTHTQNYCNICKNIFSPQESIRHIENHSIEFQGKKCMECDGTFHDEVHLLYHVQSVHPEKKPHKCTMCVKSYFSEKSMLSHKQNKHGKKSKKLFSCVKCNLNFYSEKQYETHVEFAHRSSLNCKYCDKNFSEIKKLAAHERNHLKQVKSVYKCNICGKVLKTQAALKTHKLNHASSKPLHCEVCSQHFKSFHTLREHSASHSDTQEKKYFCDICGKGFYFYDSHYRHRRIHLDPLLFQCKICKERFQTNQKLLEHKETCTSGIKCTKCLRNFPKVSDLKKHLCLPKKIIALS